MRHSSALLFVVLIASLTLIACGPESASGSGDSAPAADENPVATGSSITIAATLVTDENGELPFMTPAASAVRIAPEEVIGKPWFMAVFDAGFAPGIDAPLHYAWGHVDDTLAASFTTPADLPDGPYDVVFVVYVVTEVPDDMFGSEKAAIGGDLATFTISTDDIREGDPPLTAGVLRVNVEGEDAVKQVENRWTDDLGDVEAGTAAFTNTVLLVP